MKIRLVLLTLAAMLISAATAFANSVPDPTIIIKDPPCVGVCTPVTGTTFGFGVPAGGTGSLFFQNASDVNWFTLRLTETGVPASAITCVQNVFVSCAVGTLGNGKTFIFLSGLASGTPGITTGEFFSITFGCSKGTCPPWPAGLDFNAIANLKSATVPEPGTIALVLTGLGGIITRRRWLART
jgi:hypothetical protein